MIFKTYRNELIVAASILLFLFAFLFAHYRKEAAIEGATASKTELSQIKEAAALRRVWHPKGLKKRIEKLKTFVPVGKLQWREKGTKLEIRLDAVDGRTLNRFVGKLLSLPVRIERLHMTRAGTSYRLECKCKW